MFSLIFVIHLLNVFCCSEIVCNPQGPDDFNGYGCFYVRFYWIGCGSQANTLEEYVLLSALLRIFVCLKRTIDQKLSSILMSGPLNVAIACLMFFQFRFADTENISCALHGKIHAVLRSFFSPLFLPFPLFVSSLCCVCVVHSLSLVAQVVQSVEKHTLGKRCCHTMFLFGL